MRKYKILCILLLIPLLLCSCGKKEEEETTEDTPYAQNEVRDQTTEEEEETTEEVTTTSEDDGGSASSKNPNLIPSSDGKSYYDSSVKDITYDSEGDSKYNQEKNKLNNYDSKTNTCTMLLEGHVLTLPCTYDDIVNNFGDLYTETWGVASATSSQVYVKDNLSAYENVTSVDLTVTPKTGNGVILFTFTSSEPKPIQECLCTKVSLYGIMDGKLLEFSLEDNIHFGSSIDDVFEAYGKVPYGDNYTYEDSIDKFYVHYGADEDNYSLEIYGLNGGVSKVVLEKKISK